MLHQLAVVDPEDRGPQRSDDLELVGRVVDRAQHPQQLVHLARSVDQRATLDPIGQTRLAECVLQHTEARAAADQHGDVAIPRRPIPLVIRDRPRCRLGNHLLHEGADVGGLPTRGGLGRCVLELRPPGHAQHDDTGTIGSSVRTTLRFEQGVGDMGRIGVVVDLGEPMGKHGVDPRAHVATSAPIDRQLLAGRIGGQQAGEQLDIGVAEAVDRLLRITHREQRRRRAGAVGRGEL